MLIGLAQSWNMLAGYMGYISFGHGAFFGIGAYVTAILMNKGMPFFPSLLFAGILTTILAVLMGHPTLRLQGAYFAIATWVFAEAIRQIALILPITGGANGMRLPVFLNEKFFYFLMLGLTLSTIGTAYYFFKKSLFGLKVKAIREEELASNVLGINTNMTKIQVFALSAFFPSLLGGAYAYWITYIHPDSVLVPLICDQMVVMTLLGGLGTIAGPTIGALILFLGNRMLWVMWGETSFYLILIGIGIAFVILFLPDGVISLFSKGIEKLKLRHEKKNTRTEQL